MASVSICDRCGKIGKHENYKFIKMFSENEIGNTCNLQYTIEVCHECADKFLEIFKKNGSE